MFADADLLHDAEIAAKLGFIALQGNYDLTLGYCNAKAWIVMA